MGRGLRSNQVIQLNGFADLHSARMKKVRKIVQNQRGSSEMGTDQANQDHNWALNLKFSLQHESARDGEEQLRSGRILFGQCSLADN